MENYTVNPFTGRPILIGGKTHMKTLREANQTVLVGGGILDNFKDGLVKIAAKRDELSARLERERKRREREREAKR